ncbi:hypothetical protein ACH5RR_011706 [Cinchona calisaya]|uniref:Uncharacterized protein n=1 Tax=Cinchona calisaya TaxID=153742 RepID=A0ABD3A960_9GENT
MVGGYVTLHEVEVWEGALGGDAMQVGTKRGARGKHVEVSECGRIATYRGERGPTNTTYEWARVPSQLAPGFREVLFKLRNSFSRGMAQNRRLVSGFVALVCGRSTRPNGL